MIGCSRLDFQDIDLAVDPSSTNVAQVLQTFDDVAALPRIPGQFFLTGDFTNGYEKDDGSTIRGELNGFAYLWKQHLLSTKCSLVPLTGNHELLYKDFTLPGKPTNFLPGADLIWSNWLRTQRFNTFAGNFADVDSNGPTGLPPNLDNLKADQSLLSYSFNVGGVHFTVINTDTETASNPTIGTVPMNWVTADIQAAQADPDVKHIFVMAHKPVNPAFGEQGADGMIAAACRQPMTQLLRGNSKVRAYCCAHAHLFEVTSLADPASGASGPLQIISGNGGTPPESYWNPSPAPFFGFTQVKVYQSGRTTYTSFQRPIPSPSYTAPTVPAVAQAEVQISPAF
jgi:hypothetical protein